MISGSRSENSALTVCGQHAASRARKGCFVFCLNFMIIYFSDSSVSTCYYNILARYTSQRKIEWSRNATPIDDGGRSKATGISGCEVDKVGRDLRAVDLDVRACRWYVV
jgi:hypothetical protein